MYTPDMIQTVADSFILSFFLQQKLYSFMEYEWE